LPPGIDAARTRTFSTRRVKAVQALLVCGAVLGAVMLATGNLAGIPIALGPALQLFAMTTDQRRQILTLETLRSPADQRRALAVIAVVLALVGVVAAYAKGRDQRCADLLARRDAIEARSADDDADSLTDPHELIRITGDLAEEDCL
jgi:hypothetical protein